LARVLGDNVDQRRHRVGIGLNVQFEKPDNATGEQKQQQQHHQRSLPERESDDGVHSQFCPNTVYGLGQARVVAVRSITGRRDR
jgi:hypothetical protein